MINGALIWGILFLAATYKFSNFLRKIEGGKS